MHTLMTTLEHAILHFCMWVEPTCKLGRTKENMAERGQLWSDAETRMLLDVWSEGKIQVQLLGAV